MNEKHQHGSCHGHDHCDCHSHGEEKGHTCGCHSHVVELTAEEKQFLEYALSTQPVEVVRFLLRSSRSEHFETVAMAPVYMKTMDDSMGEVKDTAAMLKVLADYALIELDYDMPVEGFDYGRYEQSEAYIHFLQTVEEARANPNFVFDLGLMEKGRIILTPSGEKIAAM